jgi:hypothetical protein
MSKIIVATAVAIGLSVGQAQAMCTQADIGGTWGFYGDLYTANQVSALALSCTLHIDKTSGVVATDSPCESTAVTNPGGYGTVTSGTFTLQEPDNCTFNFRFSTNATNGGLGLSVEVRRSTLSENKQVLAGMLSRLPFARGGSGSIVTMIKIRSE